MSNRLFIVENRSKVVRFENNKVLLRLFGGKLVEPNDPFKVLTITEESLVCFKIGLSGLGPKVLGVFDGGRLEEFIPSRTLADADLLKPVIRMQIAQKLARLHLLEIPIGKVPFDRLDQVRTKFSTIKPQDYIDVANNLELKKKGVNCEFIANFGYAKEVDWLGGIQPQIKSRNVMCTRDLNRLNCLVRETPDKFNELITLIDFEFFGFGPRACDLAAHFTNWMFDLSKTNNQGIELPSPEIRRQYCKVYLKEINKLSAGIKFDKFGLDSVDHLVEETEFFMMMNFLFCISLVLNWKDAFAKSSQEGWLGLMVVVEKLLRHYERVKANFIEKYLNR